MDLALPVSFAPMEAKTALKIPDGAGWQFEPKWDGFRCLVFRDGPELEIQSKAGQPLARYFPELVEALLALEPQRFVIDGELVVPIDGKLSFDALLQRIHPAASRIAKLAKETPAQLIVFDLLVDTEGRSCVDEPLPVRRDALEKFASTYLASSATIHLSPATGDLANAKLWLQKYAGGLDGIVAKRTDIPYASGTREGMLKIKNLRTADCVVGGFRYGSKGGQVGSLLLGLYDNAGLLHHVGFTSGLAAVDKPALTERLEAIVEAPGFTGAAPGGPSRWSTERSAQWKPLRPELVVEVQYDHFSGDRFRHGTRLLRWRPDKNPQQCTIEQVNSESRSPIDLLKEK